MLCPEAPLEQAKTIAKINEDFNGVKHAWADMAAWRFVTNQHSLPPDIVLHLNNLDGQHPNIAIRLFGYESIRKILLALPSDRLIELFGEMPTARALESLTFQDIKPVLDYLQKQIPDPTYPVIAPSLEKLQANGLSQDVEVMLRHGMRKASIVAHYFERHPDPDFGEQIAQSYREKYQILKTQSLTGDEIFRKLQAYTGGDDRTTPIREAAILAVMSYFFEGCDIFEDAKGDYMILPTKHLRTDRALISIGAEILRILYQPKTISRVWDEFRVAPSIQSRKASINYDWFILSIDLLYVLGAVSFERGLLQKRPKHDTKNI